MNSLYPSGPYRLDLNVADGAPPDLAAQLVQLLEMLGRALRDGMFSGVTLRGTPSMSATERVATGIFQLDTCRGEVFDVASGMVEFFRGQGIPVGSLAVLGPSGPLSISAAARAAVPAALPFAAKVALPEFNRPLAILVDFGKAPARDEWAALFELFDTWAALVCGGYPPDGAPRGASGVGGGGARFLDPGLLEYSNEVWHAAPEAVAPLLHALAKVHRGCPILSVEFQ